MLWLTGHSGCGKTVLCHSVASSLEEGNQHVLMYFCDKKITSQQDGKAVLTGLIFQLVQRHRHLIRHIRREFEIIGANMIHSFATLWNIFVNMIKDLKGGDLYVVVDALDECETSSCESLLRAIRDLINDSASRGGIKAIKFLLTSRPMLLLIRRMDPTKRGKVFWRLTTESAATPMMYDGLSISAWTRLPTSMAIPSTRNATFSTPC